MMSYIEMFRLLNESGETSPWLIGADDVLMNPQPLETVPEVANYFYSSDLSPSPSSEGLLASLDNAGPPLSFSVSASPEDALQADSIILQEQAFGTAGLDLLPEDSAAYLDLFSVPTFGLSPVESVDSLRDYCPLPQFPIATHQIQFADTGATFPQNPPPSTMAINREASSPIRPSTLSTQTDLRRPARTTRQPGPRRRESVPNPSVKMRYICDRCNDFSSGFQSKKDLRRHEDTHKPDASRARFHCAVWPGNCQKRYMREDNLRRHYKNDHGLSFPENFSRLRSAFDQSGSQISTTGNDG